MLSMKKSSDSTHVTINVIRDITSNTTYAKFEGIVTVEMNGVTIIDEETIEITLTYDGSNYTSIGIFWEDYDYKDYKEKGLHGLMSTQYQEVKQTGYRDFTIFNNNYTVKIGY